ncbi:MAG: CrcB family protein [Acidimicrobiaceae bacterium]|nr:CrcB family protein [Acidimicrobiaceae bacterium]
MVAASGALGAVARYELERALPSRAGQYPWGTFWVNVSGSLAIGFVLVLLSDRFPRARLARPLIATGFLGAYTTFSTYAVEAVDLSRGHHVATAVAYALSSLIAGGVAVVIGMALARLAGRADASVELGPTEPQALEEQSEA